MIHNGKKSSGYKHPINNRRFSTPLAIYIYSIWKKVLFYENLSDLTSFSKLNMEKSPIFENLSDLTSFVYIYDEFS